MMTVRRQIGTAVLAVFGFAAVASAQPVAEAARTADWAAVRALVEQGADVTAPQGDGTTALHWAGYWDEGDMAALLLDAGADANATTDLGVTPLWTACENGSAQMTPHPARGRRGPERGIAVRRDAVDDSDAQRQRGSHRTVARRRRRRGTPPNRDAARRRSCGRSRNVTQT